MLAGRDRGATRAVFFRAWRHYRAQQPLEGIEKIIVQVALAHPEYHPLLERPDDFHDRDYAPDSGVANPFLHMGLHIAIAEQLALDQPPGVCRLYGRWQQSLKDEHAVQHRMMDCLSETLWRAGRPDAPDQAAYLDCLSRFMR